MSPHRVYMAPGQLDLDTLMGHHSHHTGIVAIYKMLKLKLILLHDCQVNKTL